MAVPSGSAVSSFSNVVVTFAMSAGDDNLIFNVTWCVIIKVTNIIDETLPLRLLFLRIIGRIRWVGTVNETEVRFGLGLVRQRGSKSL